MTKEEFSVLVKTMKTVYTHETFISNAYQFDVWFSLLEDIPNQEATAAVWRYMQTNTFPPTPAAIRTEALKNLKNPAEEMTELEAWGLIEKAVRNSAYNAAKEYDALPKNVKKAIGSASTLNGLALSDRSAVENAKYSFIRSYRAIMQAEADERKFSPGLLRRIEAIRNKAEAKKLGVDNTQPEASTQNNFTGKEKKQ